MKFIIIKYIKSIASSEFLKNNIYLYKDLDTLILNDLNDQELIDLVKKG